VELVRKAELVKDLELTASVLDSLESRHDESLYTTEKVWTEKRKKRFDTLLMPNSSPKMLPLQDSAATPPLE
jgi:hypothetical protein